MEDAFRFLWCRPQKACPKALCKELCRERDSNKPGLFFLSLSHGRRKVLLDIKLHIGFVFFQTFKYFAPFPSCFHGF